MFYKMGRAALFFVFAAMLLIFGNACGDKHDDLVLTTGDVSDDTTIETDNKESTVHAITDDDDVEATADADLYVYVCGAVNEPGVYRLCDGDRVFNAIEAAGGLTQDADAAQLNQAQLLSDGEQITVLTTAETEELGKTNKNNIQQNDDSLININTADQAQLETLSGIGSTKALAIIEYRTANGGFSSIDEIKNVDGIGEKIFEKLKSGITVGG